MTVKQGALGYCMGDEQFVAMHCARSLVKKAILTGLALIVFVVMSVAVFWR